MAVTQVNGVTINKLSLEKYRELKNNGSLVTNESYVITDIDEHTLIYKKSEDINNPIVLYDLDEGIYKLYGHIKYNSQSSGTSAITSPTLATVAKNSTTTYIQFLQPYKNRVTGYEITASDYKANEVGTMTSYSLTKTSETLTTGSWQAIMVDKVTDIIPSGKYLILFKNAIVGGGDGMTTFNPYLDGARTHKLTRQTIPLGNTLTCSTTCIVYQEFEESTTHTINMYQYADVSTRNPETTVEFIKVG